MKPPLSDITSRRQFHKVLTETRDALNARIATDPNGPWRTLLTQVQAMETWTQGGRVPTQEEREKIFVGTFAAREFEPTSDIPLYKLSQALQELQYYFQVHY